MNNTTNEQHTLANGHTIQVIEENGRHFFRHFDEAGKLLKEFEGEAQDLLDMFFGVQHGDQTQLASGEEAMDKDVQADVAEDDAQEVPNNTGAKAVESQETPSEETKASGDLQTDTPAKQIDTTGDIRPVEPVEVSPGFMNPNQSLIPEHDLPNQAVYTKQASPDRIKG